MQEKLNDKEAKLKIEGIFSSIAFSQEEVSQIENEFNQIFRANFQVKDIITAAGPGAWDITIFALGSFLIGKFVGAFLEELGRDLYRSIANKFKTWLSKKPSGESYVTILFEDISIRFQLADKETLIQMPEVLKDLYKVRNKLKIPKDLRVLDLIYDEEQSKWIIEGGEGIEELIMYNYNSKNGSWQKWKKE